MVRDSAANSKSKNEQRRKSPKRNQNQKPDKRQKSGKDKAGPVQVDASGSNDRTETRSRSKSSPVEARKPRKRGAMGWIKKGSAGKPRKSSMSPGSSDESGSAEKKKGRKPRRAKAAKKKSTKKTPRKKRTPKRRKAKEEAEPPPPPPPKEDNATPKIPKKDNRGRKRVADKAASNSGGLPPTDSGGGKVSKRSSGSATASARGPTAAEEHAEAMECVLDTQPQGGVKGQSAFDTAVQHTPRSGSRARRRSSSRSASRLQIRGQELDLTTPLFMRSFQTVRVEAESEEMVITSNVVIHPMQMTFEERKAELENLVQVRPAVINVKTMDDDGFQEEKTAQNVLIGRKMIVVERKSTLLRSDKDSGLKTSDTRKYNRVAEVQMGPPPEMGGRRTVGVLSVIAENGTTMSGDLYHKRERIVFNIGNVDFDLSDLKKLPDRCEQSSTQKRNVRFDERIFKDESSITIERDTFIDAKNGTLFNSKDPFYEKRSYDYEKFFPDGSLAWIGSARVKEDVTQKSDIPAGATEPPVVQQPHADQATGNEPQGLVETAFESERKKIAVHEDDACSTAVQTTTSSGTHTLREKITEVVTTRTVERIITDEGCKTASDPTPRPDENCATPREPTPRADEGTRTAPEPTPRPDEGTVTAPEPTPRPDEACITAVETTTSSGTHTVREKITEVVTTRTIERIITDEGTKTASEPTPRPDENTCTASEPTPRPDEGCATPREPTPRLDENTRTAPEPTPRPDEGCATPREPTPRLDENTRTVPEPTPRPVSPFGAFTAMTCFHLFNFRMRDVQHLENLLREL
ncbi:hypothetical protein Q1695_006581 [Nippostrongylus brasiliensis]|nr:hypothetical protein Q1695_006581 [Nippostrongylus brasiliensis]